MLPEAQKLIEEMAELTQVLAKFDPPTTRVQFRKIMNETSDVEKRLKEFKKEALPHLVRPKRTKRKAKNG